MKQEIYTPEWLAAQESFQQYCLQPEADNVRHWENWQRENKMTANSVAEAKMLVLQLALHPSEAEAEAELDRFKRQLPLKRKMTIDWRSSLRVAAAIAVLVIAYFVWESTQLPITTQVATTFGETRALELADGSLVMLNANSNIRYEEDWSTTDEREIWLEGEAFFEVEHRADQPFIVHTELGDVTVLGTSFNVTDRPDQFAVTLVEGSVAFELDNKTIIKLSPDEQLGVHNDTLYHRKVDVEGITAWRYDRMVFKNAPISSIVERLNQDFNWTVRVKDRQILDRKVNATIPKNDPTLLLEALSVLYDLNIKKISDREYLID